MIAQWDDHEVLNNWYPAEVLGAAGIEARYSEKHVAVLAARAKQAFFDYAPIRRDRRDPRQVYRVVRRGPLPTCSCSTAARYRGAQHRQPAAGGRAPRPPCWRDAAGVAEGGAGALDARPGSSSPATSRSAWSCPTGTRRKAFANGDPRRAGARARTRRAARRAASAGASATWCGSPPTSTTRRRTTTIRRARPTPTSIRSGSSSPARCTPARSAPAPRPDVRARGASSPRLAPTPNRPPSDGLQFFGQFAIDPRTRAATVTLHDRDGKDAFTRALAPVRRESASRGGEALRRR